MVDKIYEAKNKVIKRMETVLSERNGVDRSNVEELDKLANIVHHLAESEASCWQAEYYRNTVEQMKKESAGYGGGTGSSAGYGGGTGSSAGYMQSGVRQGYGSQQSSYGSGRSGYMDAQGGGDMAEALRKQIQEANPDERERLRHQYMTILGTL